MKIVILNQQTAFVRHWFRWYKVLRAGDDWRPLPIGQKYEKPKKLEDIAKGLKSNPQLPTTTHNDNA